MVRRPFALALAASLLAPAAAQAQWIKERTVGEMTEAMAARRFSSAALTRAMLRRIRRVDQGGVALHSVIAVNPRALAEARALDRERREGKLRGPLHGVPVLIKDNIETADRTATTAGSLALRGNVTGRDAPLVARLRQAGAVILGKTNLSEWANIRDTDSTSGWSAVGGLVKNPYALDRNACGSSSGSAVAVAASLAPLAVGTETDGSVTCPAAINGVVGLKPTLGLISRTHVVPISHSQDTPGPMGRNVRDVALLLSAMAGPDPGDAATAQAPEKDYAAGLSEEALRGVRVAVLRPSMSAEVAANYGAALKVLVAAGATLVPVERPATPGLAELELTVLLTELHADLDAYLATTPDRVTTRTLDQVIAFNTANAAKEMPWFGQDLFERAAKTGGLDDPAYRDALARSRSMASGALDAMLSRANASIIVAPSNGPAWPTDLTNGDTFSGPSASQLPAIAGYPHLTVPAGLVNKLPLGISFIAPRWGEQTVLNAGYAFERYGKARVAPSYIRPAAAKKKKGWF